MIGSAWSIVNFIFIINILKIASYHRIGEKGS